MIDITTQAATFEEAGVAMVEWLKALHKGRYADVAACVAAMGGNFARMGGAGCKVGGDVKFGSLHVYWHTEGDGRICELHICDKSTEPG